MLGTEGFFLFSRRILISHFKRHTKHHWHFVLVCVCVCPSEYWAWDDQIVTSWNSFIVYTLWLFTIGSFFNNDSKHKVLFPAREQLQPSPMATGPTKYLITQKAQLIGVIFCMLERIHESEIYSGCQIAKIKNHLSSGPWAYKQAVDFQQSLGQDPCGMQTEKHDSTRLFCSVTWFKGYYQLPPEPTLPWVAYNRVL